MNAFAPPLLDTLNATHGQPGQLWFAAGPGGLPFIHIHNAHAQAHMSLYGGQVLSFRPHTQTDLLFLSDRAVYQPGKAIRGEIRAESETVARAQLRRQGVSPTKLKKRSTAGGKAIQQKDIAVFTRQLAAMMSALHAVLKFLSPEMVSARGRIKARAFFDGTRTALVSTYEGAPFNSPPQAARASSTVLPSFMSP